MSPLPPFAQKWGQNIRHFLFVTSLEATVHAAAPWKPYQVPARAPAHPITGRTLLSVVTLVPHCYVIIYVIKTKLRRNGKTWRYNMCHNNYLKWQKPSLGKNIIEEDIELLVWPKMIEEAGLNSCTGCCQQGALKCFGFILGSLWLKH